MMHRTPGDAGATALDAVHILGWSLVGLQFAALGVLAFDVLARGRGRNTVQRAGGGALGATGLVIVALGTRTLGRSLRAHPAPPPDAVLRTDGPYRFVRHPIYAGLLLLGAGAAIAAGTSRALTALVALAAVLRAKAGLEERLLAQRFAGYDAY